MVHRCLFLRYGLNGGYEMATFLQDEERPLLCLATDQVEDHIDLLSENLLELLLSIIDNPAGSDGVEVRLIVAGLTARYSAYALPVSLAANTASPGAYAATSLPICSTTPENSCPGIHGRSIGSICLAVPEALTRSR